MNNNTFNYIFDYIPSIGDDIERIGGEKIKTSLKEYQRFLEVQHRKENTQLRYLDAAKKLLNHINCLDETNIQDYVRYLNKNYTQNTIAGNIQGMNKYLDYLKLSHLRVSTPSWKPSPRDTITTDQLREIRQHAKRFYTHMDYLIILFIQDLDTRPHEIQRARWDWIKGDKIYFQDCKTGDTTGHLTPELKEALQHWRDTKPYPNSKYVFCYTKGYQKGKPLGSRGLYVRRIVKKITNEIVGRILNPQDLRASVITEEYNHFVNPKIIQLKARHRSFKTTMRYNHVDEKMLEDYIADGTIFDNNIEPILQPKHIQNRSYIKGLPSSTSSTLIDETEDNSSFSFSISFFQTPPFLVEDMGLSFCIPHFNGTLFPQSHITSPEVIV